jgi:hypothetical protein
VAAPRLHPVALLAQLLPLLAPSASFVVYSPYLQPLAEAQHSLTSAKLAVQLRIQESWFREHQVGAGSGAPPPPGCTDWGPGAWAAELRAPRDAAWHSKGLCSQPGGTPCWSAAPALRALLKCRPRPPRVCRCCLAAPTPPWS